MFLFLSALAADLRVSAAPANAIALHAEADPGAAPLACKPLLPHISLCLREWKNKRRRWVTSADLASAGLSIEDAIGKVDLVSVLDREPHPATVQGGTSKYWVLTDSDGYAVAPLLHPNELLRRMGLSPNAEVRVALPRAGVFLAWGPGDPELDLIMAVAVREHYEPADDAVTPMVYTWKKGAWQPWGQASAPTKREEKSDGG